MKIIKKPILALFFTMITQAQEKDITIGLIGDSTVANTYGWGPSFASQVAKTTKVLNFAKNGATLESLSGKLDELLQRKPHYVLVQFGHNDQKRYSKEAYQGKLSSYVARIKKSGAQAVILSSVTRRNFDEKGQIRPWINEKHPSNLPLNAKAAQQVAKKERVPFIDLYSLSVAHHNKIGPEKSAKYHYNKDDRTHFSKEGAEAIAALVVAELKVAIPKLGPSLKSQ